MTVRERWTVYPLIFLALGVAVRDKFWPPSLLRARSLAVETLRVQRMAVAEQLVSSQLKVERMEGVQLQTGELLLVSSDGKLRAHLLAQLSQGGQLVLYNHQGKPVLLAGVEPASASGILEIVSPEGKPLVELRSAGGHGVVNAIDQNGVVVCVLGSDGQTAGLFLELPQVQKVLPLRTVPIPSEAFQPKQKP